MPSEVRQTRLPGVGVKYSLDLDHGGRVAVIQHVDGEREVLGIWWQETEGAKFWLTVLNDLRRRGVQDVLISCVDGLKGFPEAIEALRWLLSDNPLRERAWSALIRAQYLAGDTGGALSTFEHARKVIRDELGSDPSPGMRLIHEAILRHDAEIVRLGNLALTQ